MRYLILMLSFLINTQVLAGNLIISQTHESGSKVIQTEKMFVDENKIRVDTVLNDKVDKWMIYRHDLKTLWTSGDKKGEYYEVTTDDILKLQNKVSQLGKMMQEQLSKVPPEQRKLLEESMKSMLETQNTEKASDIVYEKKESNVKVDDWNTTYYVVTRDGKKIRELWTVSAKDLNLGLNQFQAVEGFTKLVQSMANELMEVFDDQQNSSNKVLFEGYPVKTVFYNKDGLVNRVMQLKTIESQNFDPKVFEISSDLKKVENPFLSGK